MTVSVTLTFPTIDAAVLALSRVATPFGVPTVEAEPKTETVSTAPPPITPYPAPAAEAPVAEPAKRRGRPPKAEPTPTPAPAQPAIVVVDKAAVITKEAALAKFKSVHDVKGLPVCLALLARLGAKRFAEVNATQYPDLMSLADSALAGEDLTKVIE